MGARIVRAACPHDCPDTCAMQVTVDGRPGGRGRPGNPEHPITAGFLCGKVSNYLDRVYSDDRVLHPLVRAGEGQGEFRRATWDEALDRVAEGLAPRSDEHGGESMLPYSYMGTQGLLQGDSMSARVMNALGATDPRADDLRERRHRRRRVATTASRPRSIPSGGRKARYVLSGAGTRCRRRRTCGACCSRRARNGARLVVVDPYRSRTARVADEHVRPLPGTDAALALGMMRAVVDAGLADEEWCRAHATGYDELLDALGELPGGAVRASCAG